MEISVDRRQLVAEHESPLSLLASLSSALVQCACRLSCCAHSVLGSWSGKLLWIPLPRRSADDSYPAAVHTQNAVSRKKKLFSGEAKNALCATVSFRLVSNTGKKYCSSNNLSPPGRRDDMPPANVSSTHSGSTSVRGRVRSPHISAYSLGSCAMGQTDGRIAVWLNALSP